MTTPDTGTPGARPGPTAQWVVEQVTFTDERVQALVAEVQAYYVEIYGGPDDSPVDPTEFDPPLGHFLLGLADGTPVAMGGWRRRPELDQLVGGRTAEVKRMFVSPTLRRRGLARQLLTALEDSSREAGVEVLALETGSIQTEAIALYESAGYLPTARFGHYADSETARYYAKRLTGR